MVIQSISSGKRSFASETKRLIRIRVIRGNPLVVISLLLQLCICIQLVPAQHTIGRCVPIPDITSVVIRVSVVAKVKGQGLDGRSRKRISRGIRYSCAIKVQGRQRAGGSEWVVSVVRIGETGTGMWA